VWVPKSSQPTKHQSQTQSNKAGDSSAPPKSVFSRLGQKSVFSRLGSRIPLGSLKITAPNQKRKKRRTTRYEEHFSVNTISISYDTDPDTDIEVNMIQDDQSPPSQTHVTNTNKNNGRKGRPPKRVNPEGNSREGEDHNENLDLFDKEEDGEVRPEVPIDEIEILKGHIEARDEELIRQWELIATMLKHNKELIKAVKSLQESQDANFNPKVGSSRQGVHSTKNNHMGKQPVNSKSHPHRAVEAEPELTGLSRKEIQAMIAQQMQIAGGGYAIPPVKNCGHPYPAVYDLEEYPKGYVIPHFRTFSGEGNKDLNLEQHLTHFVASCSNTDGNDALLLRQFPQSLVGTAF
jgi:hypothetical protein